MTDNDKFILDATAGFRMMWFNKKHPNTIYIDRRPEVEPDKVMDIRHLDFPDESFRLIVFDPPHLVSNGDNSGANMSRVYGVLRADTLQSELRSAFKELFRVLKPYGVLLFKWNTAHISSDKIIKLAPVEPLFYQISASKRKNGSAGGGTDIKTLWFCFMKIPKISQQTKIVNQVELFAENPHLLACNQRSET